MARFDERQLTPERALGECRQRIRRDGLERDETHVLVGCEAFYPRRCKAPGICGLGPSILESQCVENVLVKTDSAICAHMPCIKKAHKENWRQAQTRQTRATSGYLRVGVCDESFRLPFNSATTTPSSRVNVRGARERRRCRFKDGEPANRRDAAERGFLILRKG